MLPQGKKAKPSYLKFLYTDCTKIKNIYDRIDNNPIECNDEHLEECLEIKKLFLTKISNGMTYEQYKIWKSTLKNIRTDHIEPSLPIIVKILEKTDEELLEVINTESKNYNYLCLMPKLRKSKDEEIKEVVITPTLTINILEEIFKRMEDIITTYINKVIIIENKEMELSLSILTDPNSNEVYLNTIEELFIKEFSYLENTIGFVEKKSLPLFNNYGVIIKLHFFMVSLG